MSETLFTKIINREIPAVLSTKMTSAWRSGTSTPRHLCTCW
jgi:hypothetical protein